MTRQPSCTSPLNSIDSNRELRVQFVDRQASLLLATDLVQTSIVLHLHRQLSDVDAEVTSCDTREKQVGTDQIRGV